MQHLETAKEPSPASTSEDSPTLERRIGSKVARLAGVIVWALGEREQGQMISPEARRLGGELLADLVRWKMLLPEFDTLAREHGRQMAQERLGVPASPATLSEAAIDEMIEYALAAVTKVAKMKCN
jgi:hypothetical protein